MEKNKLKEWKLQNRLTWAEMAKEIDISYQGLNDIVRFGSPKTKIRTCMAIEKLTGLKPEEYLNGLEDYIILKKRK